MPPMALIDCPECSGTVSDQAPACIHCGFPLTNRATVAEDDASISTPIPEVPTADPYVELSHERDQIQADCAELMPDDPIGAATLAHQRRLELASNRRDEGEFTQDQYVEFKRKSLAESKRIRRRIESRAAAERQRAEVASVRASVPKSTATTGPSRSVWGGWWRERPAAERAPWIVLLVLVAFFAIWLLVDGLGEPERKVALPTTSTTAVPAPATTKPRTTPAPAQQSSSGEGDASSRLACSHFRNVADDFSAGLLTIGELREKLKEVNGNAQVSEALGVRNSARAMLAAVTIDDGDAFLAAMNAMYKACTAAGS